MKVTVIGSGFVGQATGLGLKKHGNEVVFLDVDTQKVEKLKGDGYEAYVPEDYQTLTTDISMFCVPTPTKGGSIQLEYLKTAVEQFARRLKNSKAYHVVAVRSTVPPKTTRELVLPIIEKISGKKAGKDFGLCMQPEYLREATANEDFERPWFTLIGQFDERSGDVLDKLYRPFDAPIERCSLEEAEFQKYVHNLFNAVKIAFFNEMRIIASSEQWSADMVFRATAESCEGLWNPLYGLRNFGPFDGACLPKDTRALLEWGEKHNYDLGILRAVIVENLRHEKLLGKNEKVRINYLSNIHV